MVKPNFIALGLYSSQTVGRGEKMALAKWTVFYTKNDCGYYAEIIGFRFGGDRQLRFQNVLLTNSLKGLKCWGHYVIIYSYLNSLLTARIHVCSIAGFYCKLLKPCVGPSICYLMNTCTHTYIIPPMVSLWSVLSIKCTPHLLMD